MNFFVAVTDYDWFQLHASKSFVVEVISGAHLLRRHSKLSSLVKCCYSSFTRRAIL